MQQVFLGLRVPPTCTAVTCKSTTIRKGWRSRRRLRRAWGRAWRSSKVAVAAELPFAAYGVWKFATDGCASRSSNRLVLL